MKYTFYWKNGTKEVLEGKTPEHAYQQKYSAKDLSKFEAYDLEGDSNYTWVINSEGKGEWKRNIGDVTNKKTIIF